MQINVHTGAQVDVHEAAWVDTDTSCGELLVTCRDQEGKASIWTRYAAGHWGKVVLIKGAAADVLRFRAAAAERDRVTVNTGRAFTIPAGNSGPQ